MKKKSLNLFLLFFVVSVFLNISISNAEAAYAGQFNAYLGSVSMSITMNRDSSTVSGGLRKTIISGGDDGNWGVYMGGDNYGTNNPAGSVTFFTFPTNGCSDNNNCTRWENLTTPGTYWNAYSTHSLIITWNTRSGKKIYLDGALKSSYNSPYSQKGVCQYGIDCSNVWIGDWYVWYEEASHPTVDALYFDVGTITDVVFYSYVLSDSEAANIAGDPTNPPPTSTTGDITGVLIDSTTNQGVSGATITTNTGNYTATSSAGGIPGFTNAIKGQFTISNVEAETYTLTITKTGYTTKQISSVAVTAVQTKNLGNISFTPTGGTEPPPPPPPPPPEEEDPTISGKILDGGSSNGLSGVKIEVNGEVQGTTDEDGSFSIVLADTGSYRLYFSKEGHHELASGLVTLTDAAPTSNIGSLRMYLPTQEAYLYFASSAQSALASSWWSNIVLLNPNDTTLSCSVEAYGDDEALTFTESLASLSKKKLTSLYSYLGQKSGGSWNKEIGWLRLRVGDEYKISAKQIMGASRLKFLSSMSSAVLSRHHIIPLISLSSNWWTTISILNPSDSASTNVSIKIMSESSASQYYVENTVNLVLQPKQAKTDTLENLIGTVSGNADDSWLEITSDLPTALFAITGNSVQAIGITSEGE